MNFAILIRRTENWGKCKSLDDLSNAPNCVKRHKLAKFVEKWDASGFSINYFNYRQKIKDIAIKNMQDTGITIVTSPVEFLKNNKNNENLFIIPTDDDDWLHPDIQDYILSEIKDADYISWRTMCCSEKGFNERKGFTPTNGYAYRCSKATIENLLYHTSIKNDNRIDKFLSVHVRHSAASWPLVVGKDPRIKNYPKDAPDDLKWAKPYLDSLNAIELKGSRRDLLL